MTENPADFIPIWMLISAGFGFLAGDVCGDYRRHRKCLQEAAQELREKLDQAMPSTDSIHRELKQQRGAINDIHHRLLAVSKSLQKRPS